MAKTKENSTHVSLVAWILTMGTILAVLTGVLLWALAANEFKKYDYIGRSEKQNYTITVSGNHEVVAVPDVAEIMLGVQTQRPTVAAAQQENTLKINQIVQVLKEQSVEAADIKTSNYSIYPQYDYTNGAQRLLGYQVMANITVKIRDLDRVGTIIEQAGAAGANQIGNLTFTIDDPEALQQQARVMALADARRKAEELATAADMKLGKLVSFEEQGSGSVPPVPYYARDVELQAADEKALAPDIQVGSQEFTVTVSVTYEVL